MYFYKTLKPTVGSYELFSKVFYRVRSFQPFIKAYVSYPYKAFAFSSLSLLNYYIITNILLSRIFQSTY